MLIPEENVKDLVEIPDNIKNRLDIIPVKWIDQVLDVALERKPEPLRAGRGAARGAARPRGKARDQRRHALASVPVRERAQFRLDTAKDALL